MYFEKNAVFSKEIITDHHDISRKGFWQSDSVLRRFQEIAGDHVDRHGIGSDALILKDLMWVVIRTKFEVCGIIEPGEKAILKTWFLPPRHHMSQREYLITDCENNLLIKGSAIWVVMHAQNRQIDPRLEEILEGQESCLKKNFEKHLTFLRDFESAEAVAVITPSEKDIDRNGHVNNANYVRYMCAAAEDIVSNAKIFQIDYHKELLFGETLKLFVKQEKDAFKIKGINQSDQLIFIGAVNHECERQPVQNDQ